MSISIAFLTVSDRCSQGELDLSGAVLYERIKGGIIGPAEIIERDVVPDELVLIKQKLMHLADVMQVNLILTTGGTGLGPRDVTPEATKSIIHKEATGMSLALLLGSIKITPFAMISRMVCGIRGRTLIVNLPGSPKACEECLDILSPVLNHAVQVVKNGGDVDGVHEKIRTGHVEYYEGYSKVDISQVARRSRISPYLMIEVEEALKIILLIIAKRHPIDSVSLDINDALGHVLSKDIYANDPLPPFPASVKDGYAVIASDGIGKRKVISSSIAGNISNLFINSGQCIRITTGAPLPSGADAVVQVEDTELISQTEDGREELEIKILKAPNIGQDIREIGCDIATDMKVLKYGKKLTSADLGVIAAVGVYKVDVFRTPRIGILSTGNEIQSPYEALKYGKVRDSNKITLMALLREYNYQAIDCGIVEDDPSAVLKTLQNYLKDVDVLITTGGVSMGERDIITNVLQTDLNAELHFGRINMKPGKPTKFFSLEFQNQGKFIFGLPGNPVSATVTCHLFVLPALKAMTRMSDNLPKIIRVKIGSQIELDPRPEYARAILEWKENDIVPWATLTGSQISSRLLSMVSANCLLNLPPATEAVKMLRYGSVVNAQVIRQI